MISKSDQELDAGLIAATMETVNSIKPRGGARGSMIETHILNTNGNLEIIHETTLS
jgi:hypothetical protein